LNEYKIKFEQEFNADFIQLQKKWKRNERCLAPLAFPALVSEARHRDGLHMSKVSTPNTSLPTPSVNDRSSRRESRNFASRKRQTELSSRNRDNDDI